ncbi:hypothetical protein GC175_02805 [bacterium]|nr:hypothetical protein [bacterium]
MDVQTVNVAAQEAQPPPGGRAMGKGTPLAGGSTEAQAAFQSLMASLMAPLLAVQSPQVIANQPAAGDAQASMLSSAALAAYGAPAAGTGQGVLATQGTGTQVAPGAQATTPTTNLMSMIRGVATPATDGTTTATSLQTATPQSVPTDSAATLDALRALAAGQPGAAATTSGAATTTTQASNAATLATQALNDQSGEQTEKAAAAKAETANGQTTMAAAFGANLNVTESVKGAGDVKPANATPVQQIADQVQMTLNRGENSATIRLQPAELGGVRIRMHVQDGQLHLSIEADKSGTGQLIDQQLGNLRQSLENSGMRIGDLAVLAAGRGQNGVEAMQREAAQQFRTMQMEMGSQQQQQQHAQQQQAAFAGQGGQQRQQGQFDPGQTLDGTGSVGIGAVNAAGMGSRNVWQTAAYAAVDYYA